MHEQAMLERAMLEREIFGWRAHQLLMVRNKTAGPIGPAMMWSDPPLLVRGLYSLMVRTTLEVGRSLTVGSFASFRTASS